MVRPSLFLAALFGAAMLMVASNGVMADRDYYGFEAVSLQATNLTTCKAVLVRTYNSSNLRTPVNGTCRGDGVLYSGSCYPGCPGNSTVWTWAVDTAASTVTCTLVACADGTTLCGSYCVKTADAAALAAAGMCPTVTSVLDAYGPCDYCPVSGKKGGSGSTPSGPNKGSPSKGKGKGRLMF